MGQVKFRPIGIGPRGKPIYEARYDVAGKDLPRRPLVDAQEQMKLHPGRLGYFPVGVERKR